MTLTRIDITEDVYISFKDLTPNYGRAEFSICPEYKRGKLVRLTIYPLQQPDAIEVNAQQYTKVMRAMSGLVAGRSENGRYYVKLWMMKYKDELSKLISNG